jgi:hypothetical protein
MSIPVAGSSFDQTRARRPSQDRFAVAAPKTPGIEIVNM